MKIRFFLALILLLSKAFVVSAQQFSLVSSFAEQSELTKTNGVSVADYDKDGDLDVFIVAFNSFDENDKSTWNRLLRNDGWKFSDVTISAGFTPQFKKPITGYHGNKLGASWGDYDNDGYPDLFLSNFGVDELWHNEQDGTFTNVAYNAGVRGCSDCYSTNGLWFDYDTDGDLDLYVSDYDRPNRMYENIGNGNFKEVTEESGLGDTGETWTSIAIDVNNDTYQDIYVINDNGPNFLYLNQGDRTFLEATNEFGLGDPGNGMGVAISDYNKDGLFDLYLTNIFNQQPNPFFVRNAEGTFDNKANELGIDNAGWAWGTKFFDVDHDMDEDLYVVNGHELSITEDLNVFFKNEGAHFEDVSTEFNVTNNLDARGLEVFDYDGDGDLDMLVSNWNGHLLLYRNNAWVDGSDTKNWIKIELEGTTSNRDALGATVRIKTGGAYQYRLKDGANLMGQSIMPLHFGLESNEIVEEITVTWPNGISKSYSNINANQTIKIIEEQGVSLPDSPEPDDNDETPDSPYSQHSIARQWNEVILEGIRNDFARPTVHARNLFHTSAAMYDSWAVFDPLADTYFLGKTHGDFYFDFDGIESQESIELARTEMMSYACYRLIKHRFKYSPDGAETLLLADQLMNRLGLDKAMTATDYSNGSAAALGNYLAVKIIEFGFQDGSNEQNDYENFDYVPVNDAMIVQEPGSQGIKDPNRWQPLTFNTFIDQSGNEISGSTPDFLSPEWGNVPPFSLTNNELSANAIATNYPYDVYMDPGPPVYIDMEDDEASEDYKWGFSLVSIWSSHLDISNPTRLDISPASLGNLDIQEFPESHSELPTFYNQIVGGDPSAGYTLNPKTNQPYIPQEVLQGDYTRVLAEFWADGPDSETPPGHWFTILNYVSDHPQLVKKFKGQGAVLSDLEWDVKSYFTLAGGMHDAAISAWSVKGYYDYVRPVSAIRFMAENGQSSDPSLPSYHVAGIPLVAGYIELIAQGDPLAGEALENVGKIKLYAWKGHDYIPNPDTDVAGVDWILAEEWLPYQRSSFVTPPFAGYVSGHSTFSRAAAQILTAFTGDEYFPGGVGEFIAKKNEFLVFETGPSEDVTLQWAKYYDASDQCSLSRIWGGIHPPADDINGRFMGQKIGEMAFNLAEQYFNLTENKIAIDINLYPNPSSTHVNILVPSDMIGSTIEIMSYFGQVLENKTIVRELTTIDISVLKTGLYFVRVKGEREQVKKLIKI